MSELEATQEVKIRRKFDLGDWLGDILFNSRWILYPMNIGLALAGAVYTARFLVDEYALIRSAFTTDTEVTMVALLGLVDMLMVGNLIVMIYKGSHQIFIRKFSMADQSVRPQWLDHVDSGILKLKVASSVAGITLIRLLKDFVNVEHTDWTVVVHRAIIHGICLVSCIVMALVWRITHPTEEKEQH